MSPDGVSQVAAAVTDAVHVAVRAAFDDLRKALLDEVSKACSVSHGPVTEQIPPALVRAGRRSKTDKPFGDDEQQTIGRRRRLLEAAVGKSLTGPNEDLAAARQQHQLPERAPARTPTMGPLSVQALEAGVASVLLEGSRIGRRDLHPPSPRARSGERRRSFGQVMPVIAPAAVGAGALVSEGSATSSEEGSHETLADVAHGSMSVTATGSRHNVRMKVSRRPLTSEQVLQERVRELAYEVSWSSGTSDTASPHWAAIRGTPAVSPHALPLAFYVFGVVPWQGAAWPRASAAYQHAARAVVASFVLAFWVGVLTSSCPANLSQLPLPVGATTVLLQFAPKRRQDRLEEAFHLLRSVSVEHGFRHSLANTFCAQRAVFVLMWLGIMSAEIAQYLLNLSQADDRSFDLLPLLHASSIGVFCAVILSVTCGMVHVCNSLSTLIDAFSCEVVGKIRLQRIAHEWNLTQATLRRVSNAVENCFLALLVILLFTVPCLLADGMVGYCHSSSMSRFLPGLLITSGILYTLVMAAMVSEKCTRVPALINSISFGEGTERDRQHAVDYVTSSAAGFYVFGMRLTTSMVAKLGYAWSIAAVGLVVRTMSGGQELWGISR